MRQILFNNVKTFIDAKIELIKIKTEYNSSTMYCIIL